MDPPDRVAHLALVGPLAPVDPLDMVVTVVQEDRLDPADPVDPEAVLRTDLHPRWAVRLLSWMGTIGVNTASTPERWTGLWYNKLG